jgi:hypothetical protein
MKLLTKREAEELLRQAKLAVGISAGRLSVD